MKILIVFIFTIIVSCGKSTSQYSSPNDIHSNALESNTFEGFIKNEAWKNEWAFLIYTHTLNSELHSILDVKINSFDLKQLECSNYNELSSHEKSLFFVVYFASIAKLESDFNPNQKTGTNLGLLQIDPKSAIRHNKSTTHSQDLESLLLTPNYNLTTGINILNNQITGKFTSQTRGRLLPENIFYWEVLNLKFRKKFLRYFKLYSSNIKFCNG